MHIRFKKSKNLNIMDLNTRIKKVVFFMPYPLTLRDYNRFGAEILMRNGFEVHFFDFSAFIFPWIDKHAVLPHRIEVERYNRFYNERDALNAIKRISKDSIAIVLLTYSQGTYKIYRMLSKVKIPYIIDATSGVPCSIPYDTKNINFFKKIRRITFKKLKNYLKGYIFDPKYSKYLGIHMPRLWLAGGIKSLEFYPSMHPFSKNIEILWAHALDYNIFLGNGTSKSEDYCDKKKVVFLDIGAPKFIGDDLALGRSPILSNERYYPSLCRFFYKVEKEQGVKIEIAAHPRSDHASYPDYFGQRKTIRGKTFQMIKDAEFIIAHGSTAVNFAVLLQKPIIFITTDEYDNNPYRSGDSIRAFAACFGKIAINVDQDLFIDWDKELRVDEGLYADYKHCYIKKNGSEELVTWQILANRLKNLYEEETKNNPL